MREIYDFRVDEQKAQRTLGDAVGKIVGSGSTRQVLAERGSKLFEKVEIEQRNERQKDDYFFIGWDIQRKYSKVELRDAPVLHLKITSVFEPSGEERGTVYDESTACPFCQSGAVQTNPLYLPKGRFPRKKDICMTIGGEIVVSKRVKEAFAEHNLTGARFLPVFPNTKAADPYDDWFQLEAERHTVSFSDRAEFGIAPYKEDTDGAYTCPQGRSLGLNLLSEVYLEPDPSLQDDLTFTKQFAGLRSGLLRPERFIIVSQKFRTLSEAQKWKGFKLEVAHIV